MTVDTKTAAHRREVHFDSLDDLLADVHRLASGGFETVGNWSFGQILTHLAIGFNGSLDGIKLHVPWLLKTMARLFLKKRFLTRPLPAGFRIGKKDRAALEPSASVSVEEGLAAIESAMERMKTETNRFEHPLLGYLTREEWTQFHLRHAELHMSFVRPA